MRGGRFANCDGVNFYTRDAFLRAVRYFYRFGQLDSTGNSKREIAAFFAHATHETEYFCNVEEKKRGKYCDKTGKYLCPLSGNYYGRGTLQLRWNYNYGPAGKACGYNLMKDPEYVATDAVASFKTSLWFWMAKMRPVVNQGFGATSRTINGALECNGRNPGAVQARINYFKDYCDRFGVDPGKNLTC